VHGEFGVWHQVKFNLAGGKVFTIRTKNAGKSNPYVQSVWLNNKPYGKTYLDHVTLMKGGELEFVMGDKPNKEFGKEMATWPASATQ
jgi:putative alpha-1,2-mannosidase